MGTVGPVAQAVAEIAKVIGQWMSSADRRKMQVAIEAGEKYIQTNEDKSLKEENRKKLLLHYRKRFFAHN